MTREWQYQKKPASNSSTPPVQSGVLWQRPFSDPIYDRPSSPQKQDLQQKQTQPDAKRAGFDWRKMRIFPDSPEPVQAKLTVGEPGDKYEQEADSMAAKVMTMPAPEKEEPIQREVLPEEKTEEEVQTKPLAATITPLVQRETAPEEPQEEQEVQTKALSNPTIQRETTPEEPQEEENLPVQAKAESEGSSQTSGNLESQLNGSKGGGSPLPEEVRTFMEPRFGADFSQVRVHTGSEAVQMNRDLNAQAFTHKQDVYFGAGKAPANDALTAHELTHVVQQNNFSLVQPQSLAIQRRVTFDNCEAKEYKVKDAHETAIKMCKNTITQLHKYDGTQPAKVKAALAKHFHSTTHKWYFQIAETVAHNLAYVIEGAKDAQYECHDQEDNGSTLAWSMWCVPFTDILLYRKWFAAGQTEKANTLIHEWMHRYGCNYDLGYDWEPEYINSSTFRAIHNAEPYGNIVAELG